MYGDTDIFRIKDIIHSLDNNHWSSKKWLAETLKKFHTSNSGKMVVLGGWYGLTAYSLRQQYPSQNMSIVSSDVDPQTETIGRKLFNKTAIEFETFDMFDRSYDDCSAIVSTSVEHVDRDQLLALLSNKPKDTWVALQSNNFFDHASHINCSESLSDFKQYLSPVIDVYWAGTLPNSSFDRYMIIGK